MRKPRRLVEGSRYHVIARANRKEFILESDKTKEMFLAVLAGARRRFRFSVDTLCIMDNHVHILLWPGRGESLSRIMQWILGVFAMRFNHRFGLCGHVWYDRFKSVVVRTVVQYIRAHSYIRHNPVAAGIVRRAGEYLYGGAILRRSDMISIAGTHKVLRWLLFPDESRGSLLPPPHAVH